MIRTLAVPLAAAALLSGCFMSMPAAPMYSQAALPDAVKVPTGHKVVMETVGVGRITYECREKAGAAGQYEWAFVGPDAQLNNRAGETIGRYYGPPATWENRDGSKLTGTQVAVAPAMAGSIPYQLVKANPAQGQGAMSGVSYIQRVATRGGTAPAKPCATAMAGAQEVVGYQADYIFYAPM